ncbi:MAG TPA: hypothetical protein PKH33_08435 [bacterium]|nr:hypothetical protein [bacterium]
MSVQTVRVPEFQHLCGAAVLDASPRSLGPARVWMSGYMPTRYARAQSGPIQVRAIATGSGRDGMIFVSADTCLLSPRVASDWACGIARETGLNRDRIFIITTHTHSGPDLCGLFGGVPPAYFNFFQKTVVRAAVAAWHNRAPATLFAGVSRHALGIPRRKSRGQQSLENSVVVLQWKTGDRVIATLVNIGCHGVVYSKYSRVLSADLPGAICIAADRAFGGATLFAPRAQGDVNPAIPGDDPYEQAGNASELERLAALGLEAVQEAARLSNEIPPARESEPVYGLEMVLPVTTPAGAAFRVPWWSGRGAHPAFGFRLRFRRFSIAGIPGLAAPGEILTCLGKSWLERKPPVSLLFSYCGGYLGYLMTPETFARGGYEPKVSPGSLPALPG